MNDRGEAGNSFFDMSFNTLTRINYWLWKSDQYQFDNNVDDWFKTLKIIYKECKTFISKKDSTKYTDLLTKAENHYKDYLTYIRNKNNSPKGISRNPPREIFDCLLGWEIELRFILDEKGMLMKKVEELDLDDY